MGVMGDMGKNMLVLGGIDFTDEGIDAEDSLAGVDGSEGNAAESVKVVALASEEQVAYFGYYGQLR